LQLAPRGTTEQDRFPQNSRRLSTRPHRRARARPDRFVVYIERLKQRLATALSRDVDIVVLPARRPELRETLSREAIAAF
jgi:hypothetical protein